MKQDKNGYYRCVGIDCETVAEAKAAIYKGGKDICAYKINPSFVPIMGLYDYLMKVRDIIFDYRRDREAYITIYDAKYGDVPHSAQKYIEQHYARLSFDAITLSPYFGKDSVQPFIDFGTKVIIIAHSTNLSSQDIQQGMFDGVSYRRVFEGVIHLYKNIGKKKGQVMFVIGGNCPKSILQKAAKAANEDTFFLVPGIGEQGGSPEVVNRYLGKNVILSQSRCH